MKRHRSLASLLLFVVSSHAASASAITADEFRLRSGADVVALCATPATDPLHTAAIHMCHGFGAGTFQTIMALTRHDKLAPLICPPRPRAVAQRDRGAISRLGEGQSTALDGAGGGDGGTLLPHHLPVPPAVSSGATA